MVESVVLVVVGSVVVGCFSADKSSLILEHTTKTKTGCEPSKRLQQELGNAWLAIPYRLGKRDASDSEETQEGGLGPAGSQACM